MGGSSCAWKNLAPAPIDRFLDVSRYMAFHTLVQGGYLIGRGMETHPGRQLTDIDRQVVRGVVWRCLSVSRPGMDWSRC